MERFINFPAPTKKAENGDSGFFSISASLGTISIFLIFTYLILALIFNNLRKLFKYLAVICLFIVGAILLFYDPLRSIKTGSIFGIAPFALMHSITESPNMAYLENLTNARYYLSTHGVGPRLIAIEVLNLVLFLFFYLGTRFFGILYIFILLLKR